MVVVKKVLNQIAPNIPVVGSAYGFGKTCIRVYKASSPTGAIIAGVKGIVIDCTPPVIKYPALCGAMAGCAVGWFCTGDPNFLVGTLECANAIVDN